MGRTYHAVNKKAKGNLGHNFDVNFAGADILGFIMRAIRMNSASLERFHAPLKKLGIDRPGTKWKMTAEQTKEAAARLRALTARQKANIYKKVAGHHWDAKSPQTEFDAFIEEWSVFLETSGGYEVPG